ncbi:type III PLP-dependent enzyme [Shouchella shacheensis]|uniref:type III PLP-dependent enzyme n=1 Tax=Shouchella shacheensis TaxID=1649580 RepID=UPI000740095F|nr:type III PLP-dependent enzyme [Shouchella shacheensis]
MNQDVQQWIENHHVKHQPFCAYIYDLTGLSRHVETMLEAIPQDTHLFYAIKANPDRKIIETLLPVVDGFEVASIGELEKVRSVSEEVPVLFGGPGKKEYELEAALQKGVAYIHVESLLELQRLIHIARNMDTQVSVLLRINLQTNALPTTPISMAGQPSPFGMDEQLIGEALSLIRSHENKHVHFRGFHFHSLSNNMHADWHIEMIRLYIQKVEGWKKKFNVPVHVLNAGGGFGVSYDENPDFDWKQFMSLLHKEGILDRLEGTKLFFEPGRWLVANYGYYAAEVIDIKKSMEQHFAIVRGGTHHHRLPASWGHDHPFSIVSVEEWEYPFERPEITSGEVSIVGELCTPKDRLHTNAIIQKLRVGDVVVLEKSGAYSWSISHHDFLDHRRPDFYYMEEEMNYG